MSNKDNSVVQDEKTNGVRRRDWEQQAQELSFRDCAGSGKNRVSGIMQLETVRTAKLTPMTTVRTQRIDLWLL